MWERSVGSFRKVGWPENPADGEHHGPLCLGKLTLQNVKKFFQNVKATSDSGPPLTGHSVQPADAPPKRETFYRTIN